MQLVEELGEEFLHLRFYFGGFAGLGIEIDKSHLQRADIGVGVDGLFERHAEQAVALADASAGVYTVYGMAKASFGHGNHNLQRSDAVGSVVAEGIFKPSVIEFAPNHQQRECR